MVIASAALAWLPLWYWNERGQSSFALALATVVLVWGGLGAHTLLVVVSALLLSRRTGHWGWGIGVAAIAIAVCAIGMALVADADDHPLAMALIGAWALACVGGALWPALRTSGLSR